MSWDESKPEVGDQIRDFGLVVRSHKTELRAALEKNFLWTQSSGASAGETLLDTSSNGTGVCRAFFAAQSVLSAFQDGALFVASDTSRFAAITSVSSHLLSSSNAIQAGVSALPGNVYELVQTDTETSIADGTHNVSFATAYNGAPAMSIAQINAAASQGLGRIAISAVTDGGFTYIIDVSAGGNNSVIWRSVGTVAL